MVSSLLEKVVQKHRVQGEPRLGGEGSGQNPPYLIASGLHNHVILGIDIGNAMARMAVFQDEEIILVGSPIRAAMEERYPQKLQYDSVDNCDVACDVGFARMIRSKLGTDYSANLGSETYTAEELIAGLLQYMKEDAERRLEKLVQKCVITVPVAFTSAQRQIVKNAAETAGLTVLQLINDTSAAALQFCTKSCEKDGRYLIVSMGAGSFSVSAFEFYNGIIEVKSASGDSRLGAEEMDNLLIEWLINECEKSNKVRLWLGASVLERLRRAAEQVRMDFAMATTAYINIGKLPVQRSGIPGLEQGQYFYLATSITREEYLDLVAPVLAKVRAHVEEVVAESGYLPDEFNYTLFHGGVSLSQIIQDEVRSVVHTREYFELDVDTSAAYGAAIQANLIAHNLHNFIVWDVLSLPVALEREDGTCSTVVARNTPLPVKAYQRVATAGATAFGHFTQGESNRAADNASLAEVTVNNCPPGKDESKFVEIGVMVSSDGIVDYTARHQELNCSLPVSVREGTRSTFKSRIDDLRMMRLAKRTASAKRLERLARKLNQQPDTVSYFARTGLQSPVHCLGTSGGITIAQTEQRQEHCFVEILPLAAVLFCSFALYTDYCFLPASISRLIATSSPIMAPPLSISLP